MIRRFATTQFFCNNEYPPNSDLCELTMQELIDAERFEATVKYELEKEVHEFENKHYNIFKDYWEWQDAIEDKRETLDRIHEALIAVAHKKAHEVFDDISDGDEI